MPQRPLFDKADATWVGEFAYTRYAHDAADATWVPLEITGYASTVGPLRSSTVVVSATNIADARTPGPLGTPAGRIVAVTTIRSSTTGPLGESTAWVAATAVAEARAYGVLGVPTSRLAIPGLVRARTHGPLGTPTVRGEAATVSYSHTYGPLGAPSVRVYVIPGTWVRVGYWENGYAEGDIYADVELAASDTHSNISAESIAIECQHSESPSVSRYPWVIECTYTHTTSHALVPTTDHQSPQVTAASRFHGVSINVRSTDVAHYAIPNSRDADAGEGSGLWEPGLWGPGLWNTASVVGVNLLPYVFSPLLRDHIQGMVPEHSATLQGLALYLPVSINVGGVLPEGQISTTARFMVGLPQTVIYGYLDMTYSLDGSLIQPREWFVESEWSLVYPVAEYTLDQQYQLRTLQNREWVLAQQYGLSVTDPTEFAIDCTWATAGSGFLHEFHTLLNDLRAGLGLLPIAIYDGAGPDIAQIHSVNMKKYKVYAHESDLIPVGWRYIQERGTRLHEGISYINENILLYSAPLGTPIPTQELFDGWYNSPPHYANMTDDIRAGNPNLQFLLGVEYYGEEFVFPPPAGDGSTIYFDPQLWYSLAATLNIIDRGTGRDLMPVQMSLGMQYSITTPLVERLGMEWATRTYVKLLHEHGTPYSLVVSVGHGTETVVGVTAVHGFTTFYTVYSEHGTGYSDAIDILTDFGTPYSIDQYARVAKDLGALWSMKISASHETPYESNAYVQKAHETPYDVPPYVVAGFGTMYDSLQVVTLHHMTSYDGSPRVASRHGLTYNVVANITKQHGTPYDDLVAVLYGHGTEYHLSLYNPVNATHVSFYSILSGGAVVLPMDACTLTIAGVAVDYSSVQVAADEGDAVWIIDISLEEPAVFASVHRGDTVEIDVFGVIYVGFVDGKSVDRADSTNVRLALTVLSPAAKLDAPYAIPRDYTQTDYIHARELVEDVLGQVVDWRVIDWMIPPFRFAAKDVTPLAAAKLVVEAVGAVIESNPDGSLYVRSRFPISVPAMSYSTPDHVFTDIEDNLSSKDQNVFSPIYNKFRIREGAGTVSDALEFIADEGSNDSGIIRAYLEPWRPVVMEIRHTDGPMVSLVPIGVVSREEVEEAVEIVSGEATLRFPAVAITSVEWLSSPLGTLYLEPRTKAIRATDTSVNWGYGLVRIKYLVESVDYRVQFPINNSVQFILLDKGV